MKRALFIIGFVALCFNTGFSQEIKKIYVVQMDSLYKLIQAHPKDDEEKVRLLNEYARQCFFNLEFQKGFIATRDARELSRKLDFKVGEVMYYLTLSAFHGNGEMHNYYQKEAQWLSMKESNKLSEYYTDVSIPEGYPENHLEKSLQDLLSTYHYFEKSGDKEIQASCLDPIGTYYALQHPDFTKLYDFEEQGITLYKELGLTYPYLLYSNYKMQTLIIQGKKEEAGKIEKELIESLSKKMNDNDAGLIAFFLASGYANSGRNALAIEYFLKSIDAFEKIDDVGLIAETYRLMGLSYENMEMNSKASEVYAEYVAAIEKQKDSSKLFLAYDGMVSPLIALKKYDEARKYMRLALGDKNPANKTYLLARNNDAEGQILRDQQKYAEAIPYFQNAFEGFSKNNSNRWSVAFAPLNISECYLKVGSLNMALKYALQCLDLENKLQSNRTVVKSKVSLLLSEIYERMGNQQKAFEFLKMHQQIKSESDKLDEANRVADAEIHTILEKSEKEKNELEKQRSIREQQNRNQRIWIFSIIGALLSALGLAYILFRNNKQKQKTNTELEKTLSHLKVTQKQLVQSEKMASLGELTAGIAHEIQNPLNFVNNFSEVNTELIDEAGQEIDKGNIAEVKILLGNIKDNEQKINHHGKRADAIVKGMLQHSRSSSGVKEPTDINALCDEYLRLSYHGLRAKDKSFNATMKTDFDNNIGNINIIPQDIGRVILNLLTNAFYAVNERLRQAQPDSRYEPTVSISTKKVGGNVEIRISDNGNGIPQKVLDKIFQPFFTTKPTGQGTGLGLSLSYDIVKAHGGEIKVNTKENEGTEFNILLSFT